MDKFSPHEVHPVESVADAKRRNLEPIPRSQLKTVQAMTTEQRAKWLKVRKAKRKATKQARRINRRLP